MHISQFHHELIEADASARSSLTSVLLSGSLDVAQWYEFIEAVDFVVCNTFQHPAQPSLHIDNIDFGNLNRGERDGHVFSATF